MHHQYRQHWQRAPKLLQSREYKNLRQVVPSLRCQRDVGKVEVVTEAARYIEHLHKTLIEKFITCGIPDALKDVLGTDNASELSSKHIMNLVTNMASAKQRTTTTITAQTPMETQVATGGGHLRRHVRRRPVRHCPLVGQVARRRPLPAASLATKSSCAASVPKARHQLP